MTDLNPAALNPAAHVIPETEDEIKNTFPPCRVVGRKRADDTWQKNDVVELIDATTGQNGMRQAEVFAEVAGITGIVLTKLDGTAKGGIVISVQRELGVPVKFVGLGEGADDFAPFVPEEFVDSLLS